MVLRNSLFQAVVVATMLSLSGAETVEKDAKWLWENEEDAAYAADTGFFADFRPNDENQTCSSDLHATPFDKQVRGANLGGWLVLEPWITPSLFYQFLGTQERYGDKAPEKTAMDTHSFCTALGKEEANRQLRIHYANWVTEADIKEMAEAGVNSLRVPVGDWMFQPYEPYVGCTDGAVEELDRVADLAAKYNIDLLLDIHGLKGSQNGFDNSGKSSTVKWTSTMSTQPVGATMFEHWPVRSAEWVGNFDAESATYTSVNCDHMVHSLDTVVAIVERYASHPAIVGLEPANEPWELTPMDLLKEYYWRSYKRVKARAPHWKFVIHDSFRFGVQYWSQFMVGCPDIALDTHIYQAWNAPGTRSDYYANACQQKYTIADMENAVMPVIVGEWSLGTDNCAMWLNGFNDNLPGFPNTQCRMVDCPVHSTYLGEGFPGTPLDVTKPIQGPYGTGQSGPAFGKCPVTSDTAFEQDDDVEFARNLNLKKLNAFALGHGWYFWNFKTELGSRWNFLELVRQGAFPKNVSHYHDSEDVFSACEKEDRGEFLCAAKRGVHPDDLERGLDYVCSGEHVDCSEIDSKFLTLEERADWAFNEFWHAHRHSGATCDFGGAAHLLSTNQVTSTPNLEQQQRLHRDMEPSSPVMVIFWSFVGVAVGVIVVVVAGVRIMARHKRRQEYLPLMSVNVTVAIRDESSFEFPAWNPDHEPTATTFHGHCHRSALLCSVGAVSVDFDRVHPFAQPKPVTISEKAAIKFKPSLAYGDGTEGYGRTVPCRPYPAVNAAGETSGGMDYDLSKPEACQGLSLGSQVYGRAAWHNDLWAIMYAWYFPMDSSRMEGDRHKWTAAVVWLDNPAIESPKIVAVSAIGALGEYEVVKSGPAPKECDEDVCYSLEEQINGTTPLLHIDAWWSSSGLALSPQPNVGEFQDLIMWEQMTEEARKGLSDANFGAPIIDQAFKANLKSASPH